VGERGEKKRQNFGHLNGAGRSEEKKQGGEEIETNRADEKKFRLKRGLTYWRGAKKKKSERR